MLPPRTEPDHPQPSTSCERLVRARRGFGASGQREPAVSAGEGSVARLRSWPTRRSPPGSTPDVGPACRGDGAARPGPVRCPGRLGKDDHAGGPDRLAHRRGGRPADDRGDHLQQARRRGARRAAGCGAGATRASIRAASGSGRSTPWVARSCAMRAWTSATSSTGRPSWPLSCRTCDREDVGRYDTAFSRLKLELRVDPAQVAADPDAGPVARAFVRYEAALAARGALDFDDLVRRALDRLTERPESAGAVARSLRPSPRRRGPGRRSLTAGARPAAGRAREPDLPRRRRRPVHLRLAARRCPEGVSPCRRAARPAPGRSGDQSSLPGTGR